MILESPVDEIYFSGSAYFVAQIILRLLCIVFFILLQN